jgi:hypothetical protein
MLNLRISRSGSSGPTLIVQGFDTSGVWRTGLALI